jgi:hypothetical protein
VTAHRDSLNVPVGVGGAFDFHTGRAVQAPKWMREHGFEWLSRLATEPRRLWRRYLIFGSEFIWLVVLERMECGSILGQFRGPGLAELSKRRKMPNENQAAGGEAFLHLSFYNSCSSCGS